MVVVMPGIFPAHTHTHTQSSPVLVLGQFGFRIVIAWNAGTAQRQGTSFPRCGRASSYRSHLFAGQPPPSSQCPCPCVLVCYCCCCYLSRVARVACSLTRSNRRYVECERICKFVQNKFCLYGPKTLFASSARRPFSLIAATRHIIEWSVVPLLLPLPRVSCRPFSVPCHQKALTRSFGNSHLAIIDMPLVVRVRLLAQNRARNMDCIQMNLRRGECK